MDGCCCLTPHLLFLSLQTKMGKSLHYSLDLESFATGVYLCSSFLYQFKWQLVKKASHVFYLHFTLKRRKFIEEIHEKQEQVLVKTMLFIIIWLLSYKCFAHICNCHSSFQSVCYTFPFSSMISCISNKVWTVMWFSLKYYIKG